MRIGLIALSGLRVENAELAKLGLTLPGFVERRQVIASLPSLGLLTLAGLTPANVDVRYVELESFQSGDDLPGDFDAVAISSFTAQIAAAYRLADAYRAEGTSVILGGLHVSAVPEEAARHADALVLGEGEVLWEKLIADLGNHTLQPIYDARGTEFDLGRAPMPRYELLDPDRYNRLTVQTQRGCPFRCEFCASSIRLTSKYKVKPITKVVQEVRRIKSIWDKPFLELADDNTFVNKPHSKRLVRALGELDVKWFTETDVSVAEDDELLAMLGDSGCRQLLIGFESPTLSGLRNLELKRDWKSRHFDKYFQAIEKIQSRGVSVNGCFVLGLDGQDTSIFGETLEFVKNSGLAEVQITIQTPFPGTELHARLKEANRLLADNSWDKCTLFDVTYIPDQMSVSELEDGFRQLMERLYDEDFSRRRKDHFIRQARAARRRPKQSPG